MSKPKTNTTTNPTNPASPEAPIIEQEIKPVEQLEQIEQPTPETSVEKNELKAEQKETEEANTTVATDSDDSSDQDEQTEIIEEKSPDQVEIESILSEGLENLYKDLPENRKQEFKEKGEETARAIEKLLQATKVHARKIVDLIVKWLKMIPGVNKFFLEQESKIKTDKLLEYKKEKEERV